MGGGQNNQDLQAQMKPVLVYAFDMLLSIEMDLALCFVV